VWSHYLHPDMEVLGWFVTYQLERWTWSYSRMWCICQRHSISSHHVRTWGRMTESNGWISTISTSTISIASRLPLCLRSTCYSFCIVFWIELSNWLYSLISATTAACWHLRWLGIHLGTTVRSGCYGITSCHTSVSKLSQSYGRLLLTLPRSPEGAIARAALSAN